MLLLQNPIPSTINHLQQIADSLAILHKTDSIKEAIGDSILEIANTTTGFIGTPLPETLKANPIVTISLLVLFFLFGYVLSFGQKMILETTKDFFHLKERSSIFIESTNLLQIKISFVVIFVGSIGLFLFSLYFHEDNSSSLQERLIYLALFFAIALTFLFFKVIIFKLLSHIFLEQNTSSVFFRGYFTIIFGLGLTIYPVVVGLIYTPENFFTTFLFIGLFLILISFILILYKIIQIFLVNFYSLFYIILYLCALEILPVLIVLKALS